MELSIICVNWNSLDYLRECIASIYEHSPSTSFEIIVVDNASPEGGIETLAKEFPEIKIVESKDNLGFARANNLGFRNSTGELLLLLNPDTKVLGRALDEMCRALRSLPDAGIVGGKLLNTDLSVSTTSIQKFPTIVNQLLNVESLRLRFPACPLWDIAPLFQDRTTPLKVDVIPGACLMVRREIFQQVGGFTEDYFIYAEDIDLNFKVNELGYSSYYVAQAQVIHHGGKSSSRQASQWSTIMTYRAMSRFYQRTRGYLYALAYRATMGCSALIRLFLLALAFPFGDRQGIRWTASKWGTVLKWAIGINSLA